MERIIREKMVRFFYPADGIVIDKIPHPDGSESYSGYNPHVDGAIGGGRNRARALRATRVAVDIQQKAEESAEN